MTEEVVVYEPGEGADKAIVERINDRLNMELADPKVMGALIATTFKGLDARSAKQAMMEGMIRGFKFEDFLQKNVYAIPYGSGYSLVTSIDHARKIGQKSGIVGKDAPVYTYKEDGKSIDTCRVTVKKVVNGIVGDFTAEVSFDEYTTKKNLWSTKPKTMIAKVAEMHALRMACPEAVAQMYSEEELEREVEQPNRFAAATKDGRTLKMGNLKKTHDHETETEAQDEAAAAASESTEAEG